MIYLIYFPLMTHRGKQQYVKFWFGCCMISKLLCSLLNTDLITEVTVLSVEEWDWLFAGLSSFERC